MAIYHFHAEMVSRKRGQSVVACAAYRAGESLHDQRLGQTFDYTRKVGVEYSQVLAPPEAPSWVRDRETLWNTVEAIERRKDAQLARQVIIAMPIELSRDQQIKLLNDFARDTFVSRGMVADVALHLDDRDNPHAHILLTTRDVTPEGFGLKRRDWNQDEQLEQWRAEWAETQNQHLALAGFDLRVDHRTLDAQGIDLVPGNKIGISAERQKQPDLPRNLAERIAERRDIAAENGRRIIADPNLALQALTHMQATFTKRDIGKYLHTRTDGAEQFDLAYLKVTTSPELFKLGTDEHGSDRYTTLEMLGIERNLLERAQRLANSSDHVVSPTDQQQIPAKDGLSPQQRAAFEHVTAPHDLAVVVGVAGAGKSTMLKSAREAWEVAGFTVKGAALAGIHAENLEGASGITARTLASWELSWSKGRDLLGKRDVLVIDEAGLIGTRQLARVLEHAEKAGAKVVLVGDPEQLQAIEAGAAFRGIAEQSGMAEMNEVRRQNSEWQREATKQFAAGKTIEALEAYDQHQAIHMAPTKDAARKALLSAWRAAETQHPGASRIMLAYTRDDVRQLNEQARELRRAAGELGNGEVIQTERGAREFATGDRVLFLRNERSLGVKNGSVGTLEKISGGLLQVRLDGKEGHRVMIDPIQYAHLDHGYATTVHKSQGASVDHTFALLTPHLDRHSAYVVFTRHRESVSVFYGAEDFGDGQRGISLPPEEIRERFQAVLSRARHKELAHDYLERDVSHNLRSIEKKPLTMDDIDQLQQRGAERWLAKQQARELGSSLNEGPTLSHGPQHEHDASAEEGHRRAPRSLEDDFNL
jgi:Ti-type conjugative transfer relaxase TraA